MAYISRSKNPINALIVLLLLISIICMGVQESFADTNKYNGSSVSNGALTWRARLTVTTSETKANETFTLSMEKYVTAKSPYSIVSKETDTESSRTLQYSLDGGVTYLDYSEPFTVTKTEERQSVLIKYDITGSVKALLRRYLNGNSSVTSVTASGTSRGNRALTIPAIGYDITYSAPGATNVPEAHMLEGNYAGKLSARVPYIKGQVFEGWVDQDGNTYASGGSITPTKNINLTAVFGTYDANKANRIMFSVGKSSDSSPSAGTTPVNGAGDSDYGNLSNLAGEGYQYEVFQSKMPDGYSYREWMLARGSAANTRSVAFADDAAPGYSYVTGYGASDYDRYDLDAKLEEYKDELRATYQPIWDANKEEILDEFRRKAYPVGSVYISTTNESVADVEAKLGGEWEELLEGQAVSEAFLWATGNTASYSYYKSDNAQQTMPLTLGSTGGEKTVTLGTYTMPSHGHGIVDHSHVMSNANNLSASGSGMARPYEFPSLGRYSQASTTAAPGVYANGSGGAHNNMPPYITVRAYKKLDN